MAATDATAVTAETPFVQADKNDLSEIADVDGHHVGVLTIDTRQLPSDNPMNAVKIIVDVISALDGLKARRCRADTVRVVCDKNRGYLARVACLVSAAVKIMCPVTLTLDFGYTTMRPTRDTLGALCTINAHVDRLVIQTPNTSGSNFMSKYTVTNAASNLLKVLRPRTIQFFASDRHMALVWDIAWSSCDLDCLHVCVSLDMGRGDVPIHVVRGFLDIARVVILTDVRRFSGVCQESWDNVRRNTLVLVNCAIELGMICMARCAARSVGRLAVAFHAKSNANRMYRYMNDFGARLMRQNDETHAIVVINRKAPVGVDARPPDEGPCQGPPPPTPMSTPSDTPGEPVGVPSPRTCRSRAVVEPVPPTRPSVTSDAALDSDFDSDVGAETVRRPRSIAARTAAEVDDDRGDDGLLETLVHAMDTITALSHQLVAKRARCAD